MLEFTEVPDYSDIKIVRCHRKGVKQPGSDRPIIAKFHWFGDIQTILSKKSAFKKPFLITQDWPKEIQEKRVIAVNVPREREGLPSKGQC